MSEAKHTPGPWHFHAHLSGSENHRGYRVYGPGASGWSLAEVQPCDEDGIEGCANAHLIAAAPELLEALKTCLLVVECLAADSAPDTIAEARAAIAKATGESA